MKNLNLSNKPIYVSIKNANFLGDTVGEKNIGAPKFAIYGYHSYKFAIA